MVGCVSNETQFQEDQDDSYHGVSNSDYSIDELFVSSDDSNMEMSVVTISLY
jgi:hypothetical protein